MRDKLINLFKDTQTAITFKNIKRSLSINKKHLDAEVRAVLKDLELEGILFEDDNGVFKSVPSNFFVTELKSTRKGLRFIEIDDNRFYIDEANLNGALVFDKVLVSIDKNKTSVVKVIERAFSNVVCEVALIDGVKILKPLNSNKKMKVVTGSMTMKKLNPGDVALFSASSNKFDGRYELSLVKKIGKITDDNIMNRAVACSNGFDPVFEDKSYEELENIDGHISEEEISKREDYRKLVTFTIDEQECLDMDDAISIKKNRRGYTLYVHIAHVSHYVKLGSKLFEEALSRCTSLYYDNQVMPMLPDKLSKDLCSLNENEDKLARSVVMRFDLDGNLINYKIVKSVIRSDKKMNYDDVNKSLNSTDVVYPEYLNELKLLREIDKKIINKNSFKLFSAQDMSSEYKCSSHNLIRDFMIMANHLVAISMTDKPCIYRNQPYPSNSKIKDTLLNLDKYANSANNLSNINSSHLYESLIRNASSKDQMIFISNMLFSTLRLAYYSESNEGHFSLGFDDGYVHFTSPIRRISDLVISNILDMYDEGELNDKDLEGLTKFIREVSVRASRMERMAERCQCELENLNFLKMISDQVGAVMEGYIEEIHEGYIVVRCKYVSGIINFEDLSNNNFKMLPSGRIKNKENGRIYKVGHKLEVKIKDVSLSDGVVYFSEITNLTLDEAESNKNKEEVSNDEAKLKRAI